MRKVNYALLKQLAAIELPEREAFITSDMSLSQVEALQGAKSVFKKLEDLVAPDAAERAIDLFMTCNADCQAFVLEPKRLYDDVLIEQVKYLLEQWTHPGGLPIGLGEIFDRSALGSGANIKSESDDFYTKVFNSPLSASHSSLHVLYETAITCNPVWAQAEKARGAKRGKAVVSVGSITAVPKQFEIKRTVITEAVVNMLLQRGLGLSLDYELLKWTGISLTFQPDFNREMARIGSIDGSFGTIDLRSASDRNALECDRRILPRYLVSWLERLRTTHVRRPDGGVQELFMVSSMGNGYTFSLQTMIFAAIVVACYMTLGIPVVKPRVPRVRDVSPHGAFVSGGAIGNFGVFGDDIVVVREAYSYVCHALELFGFVVNADKSFNTGDFRESCGEDYWRGNLVRGIYIKNLTTTMDCFSAINRLIRWSARSKVCVDLLVSHLASYVWFLPVPPRDGDSEGLHVPFDRSGISFYSIMTRSPIYRALTTVSESWKMPEEDDPAKIKKLIRKKKLPQGFFYNSDGIMLSLLNGTLREGRVTISRERDHVPRSKVVQRTVPFWDYCPDAVSGRDDAWFSVIGGYVDRCFRPRT